MNSRVDHDRGRMRRAVVADIPPLFAVRTSVNENHLDLEQLADRGVTTESIAAMLADGFYRAAGWHLVGPADHGDVRYEKHRPEAVGPASA